jgi:hypothetical protein
MIRLKSNFVRDRGWRRLGGREAKTDCTAAAVWIADRLGDIAINWLSYRIATSIAAAALVVCTAIVIAI